MLLSIEDQTGGNQVALIDCPECKKRISDKAAACPDCGAPIQASRPEFGKSKTVASLLALFLGPLGLHKMYLGQSIQGQQTGNRLAFAEFWSTCLDGSAAV